jgi:signal transduction histidine kinase
MTLVAIPVAENGSLEGVLLLLQGAPRSVQAEELQVLSIIGKEMAGVVRGARLQSDLQGRFLELQALFEVSRTAASDLDLDPLMDKILQTAVQVMGARGGVLRVLDEQAKVYRVSRVCGRDIHRHQEFQSGPESDCEVVRTGQPYLIKDAADRRICWDSLHLEVSTCLCVPLEAEGRVLGVLSIYDKVASALGGNDEFTEQDIHLVRTMAGFIANAMGRAMHHQRVERLVAQTESMVRDLSILYAASEAMMKTVEMERLLRVILMAITVGEGLGFNRAMLFLVNEAEGVLEGRVGVGPGSAVEAGRVWAEVSQSRRSLSEWLEWGLEQEKWMAEESAVHRVAKAIRVPLTEERCILIRALKERKPFLKNAKEALFGLDLLGSLEIGEQFAGVPVVAKGECLGVILVDNIYSSQPIKENDLRFLTAFASQAGLAIQNVLLYEGLKRTHKELRSIQQRLIQSEKLAALGEFAATMAHEIRNPLVSIGGYARLLQKKHRNSYSQIIFEEVERLEGILNRVLAFSRSTPGERNDEDLNHVVDEVLRTLRLEVDQKRLKLQKEFTQSLPPVNCDKDQIKQVFLNLLHNALEAMGGRGLLGVRTYLVSQEDGLWVAGEVADTGGGISQEVLQNIFNPFFTTKERGTGLGLAITRRIVEAHGGRIDVENRPGEGTTFRVKLPAAL